MKTITKDEIKKMAVKLCTAVGKTDIIQLANKVGVDVYKIDNPRPDEHASIKYNEEEKHFEIWVNTNQQKDRMRFSIAHELAHFVLHKNDVIKKGQVDRQDSMSLSPEKEQQADKLAAELLAPEEIAKNFLENTETKKNNPVGKDIIQKFQERFEISFVASIVRIRELGYYVPFYY